MRNATPPNPISNPTMTSAGRRRPKTTRSMIAIQSGAVATSRATTPVGAYCSARMTPPLRHVSRTQFRFGCHRRPGRERSGCLALVVAPAGKGPTRTRVVVRHVPGVADQPPLGGLPLQVRLLVHRPRVQTVVVVHARHLAVTVSYLHTSYSGILPC